VSAVTTLAVVPERADLSVRFTPEQRRIILETCCGGASESEAAALIEIAQVRGLNPILGECYFVQRYDGQKKKMVWAVQASIDSLRIKAEQTGLYAGQDEPEYEYDAKGNVILARVKVWRRDWTRPAVGVARWSEYVQTTRDGNPSRFWAQMPHNQLAKCAEALALRKAFPAVLAKLYTPEEMAQADNPEPAAAPARAKVLAPPSPAPAPAALPAPKADGVAFERVCAAIDKAETARALNGAAVFAAKEHREGRLTDGELEHIKVAIAKARERQPAGPPVPAAPESEPRAREPGEEG
jgi:phage recombination protein Bet